jgi:dTDP-4-amino-4,6-dideoxygalactose transaminase
MKVNIPSIEGGTPVRPKDKFLVFGRPYIQQEEIDEVVDTLKSGWIGTGPKTTGFEKEFAKYQDINYAVGLSSCTSGLFLSLRALELPKGSEVISTAHTFTATIASIIHNNLKPVLIDCQQKTQNIEWSGIEQKITPKTKALLIVAFAGLPCEMDEIIDIAKRYNLYIILDNAHAIEAEYKGKKLSQYGDISNYSFYSTKNLTTAEGGMLCSNNKEYINYARLMSLHGLSAGAHTRFGKPGFKTYDVLNAGFKMNMTDVAASMGIHQLSRIKDNWYKREHIWDRYTKELVGLPIYLPPTIPSYMEHSYHLFTIQLKLEKLRVDRDYVLSALQDEGIGVGVHYTAIHQFKYYRDAFGWSEADFPVAQWLSDRTISLPLSPALSDEDVDDVIEALHKVLKYYKKI